MQIELHTDASFHAHKTGWAFWVCCKQFEIQKAGKEFSVPDCTGAEIFAVLQGLKMIKRKPLVHTSKIVIITDCAGVITALDGKGRNHRDEKTAAIIDDCFFTMLEICVKLGYSIRDVRKIFEFRKVKAHTFWEFCDDKTKNKWCDTTSRSYRKKVSNPRFTNVIHDLTDLLF